MFRCVGQKPHQRKKWGSNLYRKGTRLSTRVTGTCKTKTKEDHIFSVHGKPKLYKEALHWLSTHHHQTSTNSSPIPKRAFNPPQSPSAHNWSIQLYRVTFTTQKCFMPFKGDYKNKTNTECCPTACDHLWQVKVKCYVSGF